MTDKLSHEVNVVAYNMTYEVQDERIETSIPGYAICELDEEADWREGDSYE
jgi:hypothetical protein